MMLGKLLKQHNPQTEIFVFGSNKSGRHGKGAALDAVNLWQAKYGVGEGRTGNAYAIPTKKDSKSQRDKYGNPLLIVRSLTNIHKSVLRFNQYVENNPELIFLLTEIGCGYAGYSAREVAPLFVTTVKLENVFFPYRFVKTLGLRKERMSFDEDLNLVRHR